MAKKSLRGNYIKIGLIALGVIILFGVTANITDVFVIGFDAVPFNVPINLNNVELSQLALATNFAVDCRVWLQGEIVDVNGVKRTFQPKTQTFNPQFTLDIISPQTEAEISSINTEIRTRCDPGSVSGFTFGEESGGLIAEYVLTGGTVQYQWFVRDCEDAPKCSITNQAVVTQIVTGQISASDKVLQTTNGGGITLAKPTVTGKQIDDALTSTAETYFTVPSLKITVKPEYKFTYCFTTGTECVINQNEFATVSYDAGVGTVKVHNAILDPPKPSSEIVKLVKLGLRVGLETVPVYSDSTNIDLEVRIQLPQWVAAEGVPVIDIARPTATGTLQVISTNVPITIKKVLADGTTYEFSDTNIQIPDNPVAGNWVVVAKHPGRTGEDTGTFSVLKRDNQKDSTTTVKETGDEETTEDNPKVNGQDPRPKENGNGNGEPFNFLSIGDLVECIQELSKSGATGLDDLNLSCFNDSKFIPIFGIVVIIVLLSVITGRRS